MGQRLGRLNINHHNNNNNNNIKNSDNHYKQQKNSKIINNKSVTITIRMLKMEPTAIPVTTNTSSLCGSYGGCNNNNNSCNGNNNNNNICDSHLISNNLNNNNQTHINSSNINNNFSTNSDCSNIINNNNNNNNSDDTINDIANSFKINLNSTSGGQLIKQTNNNNYDHHKITLVDSLQHQQQSATAVSSSNGTTTSTNGPPTTATPQTTGVSGGSASLKYLLNLSNLSAATTAAPSCNNHHNHQNQQNNNEVPSTSLSSPANKNNNNNSNNNNSNNTNNNNNNNNVQALVPCENCRRKLKPKLCKTCRNLSKCATNDGNGNEKQPTSKKGNWCISRFKRGSNSNSSKTAAANNNNSNVKVNNSGTIAQQQQQQSITVVNNNININNNRNCNCNNRINDAATPSANATTTTTTTTTTGTSAFQLPLLASPTPQQLRTASLQFYQPQNNQIIINNSVSESGDGGRSDDSTAPSTATLLQRFYSPNGNNFVFVLNQGQPLIDVRLAVDDPALEDCDEQARIQRAKEIAEGVEPPPGFKSNTQLRPQPANQNTGSVMESGQLVGHSNGGSLVPAVQTTAPNGTTPATTGQSQWHMVQTFNLLANNILLQNGMFLSPEDMPKPHSQVDFIHCLVPDLQKITSCSFYWGKMDRYEAERLLEGKPEGTFLLRDSAQEEFLFSVSFRKYTRSLHARIEQFNHKFSFDSHDPGVYTASTVTGLLEHYKDPTCVMFFEPMLTIPLNRNFPFSLQQLCRATIVSNTTYDGINNFPIPSALKSYLKEYHYKQRLKVRRFDEPAEVSS